MNDTAEREDASSKPDVKLDETDSVDRASKESRDVNLDLESALERLGLDQIFERLFERTLSEMGELKGEMLKAGEVVMS